MNQKDEKELVDTYREMTPENRANLLAYARVALSAEKTAKKAVIREQSEGRKSALT